MRLLMSVMCMLVVGLYGCAGSMDGTSVSADDPRAQILRAAMKKDTTPAEPLVNFSMTKEVLPDGTIIFLPNLIAYAPRLQPDYTRAVEIAMEDPWPKRIHATATAIGAVAVGAIGWRAVDGMADMGKAVIGSGPSITNSGTITTSSVGGDGSSVASPSVIGGDAIDGSFLGAE